MGATEVVADTTLLSNNFFLDIEGSPISMLTAVSGLEISVEVTDTQQGLKDGKITSTRLPGNQKSGGTLTLNRLAPTDSGADGLWKWFQEIVEKGALNTSRKSGSVVLYSTDGKELARYNFEKGWPSKIELAGLDVSSGEPLKETILLEFDLLKRTK
ncbi:phage tail protein [Kineosporia babensis]|uniref:Phage tail protein n=1 Tax=Kineosporia babensis TaxID=499548 RepID=A0A9X1NCB7_9ACTN|nr:phage tail protein [Kineosporia babensis]MCD5310428.1 phage tail protein [Kineosporia babensis]